MCVMHAVKYEGAGMMIRKVSDDVVNVASIASMQHSR